MGLPKSAVLRPAALLPIADADFARAVEDVALIASGLTQSIDASMLAIALPSESGGNEARLMMWSNNVVACPVLSRKIAEVPMFAPAIAALCRAADDLFATLTAWQWHDVNAPGLSLVTDGTGMILSAERPPAGADSAWLIGMMRPPRRSIVIRAPRRDSLWSLLMEPPKTMH